jgi:hypothetical protein
MPATLDRYPTDHIAEAVEMVDGISYALIIHPEDTDPEGNASAIDDDTDAEILAEILDRLSRGDLWAWCTVECRAEWNGFKASDFLGACNYRDANEFREEGGYWQDMKAQALDLLRSNVAHYRQRLKHLPEVLR